MNNPFTDVFCKHCGEFVNPIYGGDCPNCGERIPGIDNSYEEDTDDEDDDDIEEDDEENIIARLNNGNVVLAL